VFDKDSGDDVRICYCFDWTRGKIKEELHFGGETRAEAEIAREVRAGHCSCDIKNPKGECCLGDIRKFVKSALTEGGWSLSFYSPSSIVRIFFKSSSAL
jgi:hypothetical protein